MNMTKLKIDNTLIIDNALTNSECDTLIEEFSKDMRQEALNTRLNYEYNQFGPEYNNEILNSLVSRSFSEYKKTYPTIDMTRDKWQLQSWRFKRFPPGKAFSAWHSEHETANPYRILCCLLYLSDHNCGTEFHATGETVLSKKGRIMIFPAFWTHVHRGQVCPDNKERFIMSAYVDLLQ
jgi:hypothetical protein